MIITFAFDVKNRVDVMEGWPVQNGTTTFFLEREGDTLKRVCLSFSEVDVAHAPTVSPPTGPADHPQITISGGIYAQLARQSLMSWQAVVSGVQILDIDYDNYEMRFHAENTDEDENIPITSFRRNSNDSLNSACDFEQLGRAFCVGNISDDRVEYTSHFREGRLAFEAGRYVDAYNNMFLFLETRYCDGKTKTTQQVDLLCKSKTFSDALEQTHLEFEKRRSPSTARRFELLGPDMSLREKINALVLLRGKLRHHSLKSPHRWDPNKQSEYQSAAQFLGAVVGDIVIKESLEDIYATETLAAFREISVRTGNEIKINLSTSRLEREKTLALDMSYPTTVPSTKLCISAVRSAIDECTKVGQLGDTVRFEATQSDLELFSLAFDTWAYSSTRSIESESPIVRVRCSFEHLRDTAVTRGEFYIPVKGNKLTIADVWRILRFSFDHIEDRDPTTRIVSLRLFINNGTRPIVSYRIGAVVKH